MAATASPPFDLDALGRFLAEASGAGAVELRDFEKLTGGAIQENWGFAAVFDGCEHLLVLRTDAATGVAGSLGRADEFAVLRAVHQAGVTVAEPLWVCADPAVIGRPFFVMRRMPGTPQGREITADPALAPVLPGVAARLGRELAQIQMVRPPRSDLAFLADEGTEERIAGFRAYLDAHPRPRPVLEWAISWLETHLPEPLPPVLCHRDFRTGNYLLAINPGGVELTAILDWEFAGWGDPDEDIGWLCCKGWRFARLDRELGGIADRAPFYEAYEQASGRRLDPARVRFWEVFANVRWAIIALQQSDRHLIGGARDLTIAIIGRRATECDLELLMLLDRGGAPAMGDLSAPEGSDIRDLPSGGGLLELGREWLIGELVSLVPPEWHRELRLVATAMSIAAREAANGGAPAAQVLADLRKFYDDDLGGEAPTPTLPRGRGRENDGAGNELAAHQPQSLPCSRGREGPGPQGWEGGGSPGSALAELLQRFAHDLRVGAFEACEPRAKAARAILWRLTILKLREGNPSFLAANGFGE